MKKIYIHCGLHKTGTTSLQKFLSENENLLNKNNITYPKIGNPKKFSGQHNIAWEISRDRRFRNEYGTLKDLILFSNKTEFDIIISSEDFESSLLYPKKWDAIKEKFRKIDRQIVFIIFIRDKVSYIHSLYCQLLKMGFGDEYRNYLKKIKVNNIFYYNDYEFIFDAQKIKKSLENFDEKNKIFIDYRSEQNFNVVEVFLNSINIETDNELKIYNQNTRKKNTDLLIKFLANRKIKFEDSTQIVEMLKINNDVKLTSIPSNETISYNISRLFSQETYLIAINIMNIKSIVEKNYIIQKWLDWVTDFNKKIIKHIV